MGKSPKKKPDKQKSKEKNTPGMTSVNPDKYQERKEDEDESKGVGLPERDFKKNLGCG